MIVLEFRHISTRLCLTAVDVDHAAHAVAATLRQHGFKEACVVSHSFGTFVASRLCQMHPSMIQSLVSCFPFSDPIIGELLPFQ
jgi:pimeloyl-ACP methyl ester carboxylesterase